MVAKTFQGLEGVLAGELQGIGAQNIEQGIRMVSFDGDLATLYKANMCCRTALRILKPFFSFDAGDADELYAMAKTFDWSSILYISNTFAIDSTVNSNEFRNSQYVTYRVKDAVVDWFRDHSDGTRRPRVSVENPDFFINVHVSGRRVTLSLDSSGESLHRRGWRKAQTEAPISEVLAAGILLLAGYDGSKPFVDPMCGSGTFAIEAAMIAAGIKPGMYRQHYAFENWRDFDADLMAEIYNDDSAEHDPTCPIVAADILVPAIEIARTNARSAGVERFITFERRDIADWTEAPQPAGLLVTNPPYGRRIGDENIRELYHTLGTKLKRVFTGYTAWIIGFDEEHFRQIGLAPSQKLAVNNGGLDCQLREYVIFDGKKNDFRAAGGRIKAEKPAPAAKRRADASERPFNKDRRDKERRPRRDFDTDNDYSETSRERRERRFERTAKGGAPRRFDRDERPGKDRGEHGKERRFDRDSRPADRRFGRDERPARGRDEREGGIEIKGGRRPISVGRQPSLPAEGEIVLRRPTWRARKPKTDNNEE